MSDAYNCLKMPTFNQPSQSCNSTYAHQSICTNGTDTSIYVTYDISYDNVQQVTSISLLLFREKLNEADAILNLVHKFFLWHSGTSEGSNAMPNGFDILVVAGYGGNKNRRSI